jgi:hypothetical protein
MWSTHIEKKDRSQTNPKKETASGIYVQGGDLGGEDKSFVFFPRNLIRFHRTRGFDGLQTGIRKKERDDTEMADKV